MPAHWRSLAEAEDGDTPTAPAGRFSGLEQYPDADLIAAIARADNSRFAHSEWVGIDATNPAAPDMAHPTIPGYLLKTPEDKAASCTRSRSPALLDSSRFQP